MSRTLSKFDLRPKLRLLTSQVAFSLGLFLCLVATASTARARSNKALSVFFVDVEGGQATLFVTPAHESLLIDTGWMGNDGRDANRIVAAAKKAGINKIDYVLITHFHADHVGGVPQLESRIPIGTFIDHGDNRETTDATTVEGWQAYQKVLATGKFKRIVAKPGDALPIRGIHATVVSSDGALITSPPARRGPAEFQLRQRTAIFRRSDRKLSLFGNPNHARQAANP